MLEMVGVSSLDRYFGLWSHTPGVLTILCGVTSSSASSCGGGGRVGTDISGK